jgi:hypothetical protein
MKNGKSGKKDGWRGEKDEFCPRLVRNSEAKDNGGGDLVADWGRMRNRSRWKMVDSGWGQIPARKQGQGGSGRLLPDARVLVVDLNNLGFDGGRLRTASPTFKGARLPFLFGGKCG